MILIFKDVLDLSSMVGLVSVSGWRGWDREGFRSEGVG
jgi:hypothetical protein